MTGGLTYSLSSLSLHKQVSFTRKIVRKARKHQRIKMDNGLRRTRERLLDEPPIVKLDRMVPYRRGFALTVPETSGVYLISDLRGVLYAGKSDNLARRFAEHADERDNPRLARAMRVPVGELFFSWTVLSPELLDAEERRLVRSFQPPCNRCLYLTHLN